MSLPLRTVKYVVDGALREMVESTAMDTEAPDGAAERVFNVYIDMIVDWESQRIVSGMEIPNTINFPLSAAVPAQNLIYLLTKYAAGQFQYALTALQSGGYSTAWNTLISGQCKPSIANNPVPNGFLYYNRWPLDCCRGTNEQEFHDECINDLPIISNEGTVLVSGT